MKKLLVYGLGLTLIGLCIYRKRDEAMGIAAVLIFTVVFSAALSPLCTKLEQHGIRFAAGYAVIGLFMLVMLVFAAFIPYLVTHSVYLIKRISPIAAELMHQMTAGMEGIGFSQLHITEPGAVMGQAFSRLTGVLAKVGMAFAAQAGRILFSLVLTYYVLRERRRIGNHLLLFIPTLWRRSALGALCACRNAALSYYSCQLKTSAFVSLATYIGLLALRVPDALLLALFMGILEMLPYVGPVLAAVPILLSSIAQGIETAICALILIILVQQIEGNFVSPYFTATSTSVHPLAAIVGVFVLGSLFGIWGVLFAVPLMVLLQSVLWTVRQSRMRGMELQMS